MPVSLGVTVAWWGISWNTAAWGAGIFLLTFSISLIAVGFLLVRLPSTFFLESHNRAFWANRRPALRWSGIILKNILGVGLVVLGVLLSLPGIPGQGLLTILIGVVLLDFPGKRRLERKIIGSPRVSRPVNALRARYGKPPFELDGEDTAGQDAPRQPKG